MTITYHCPNCDRPHELECYPGTPAKLWGPPEDCYPGDGAEYSPGACEGCGTEFNDDTIIELIEREKENAREDKAEARRDREEEARWEREHDE